jgi:hypothetical protein
MKKSTMYHVVAVKGKESCYVFCRLQFCLPNWGNQLLVHQLSYELRHYHYRYYHWSVCFLPVLAFKFGPASLFETVYQITSC